MRKDNRQKQLKHHIRKPSIVVQENETVEQVLNSLRKKDFKGKIIYFYAVDEANRLQGVVPTRSLLLADLESPIADIMERAILCLREDDSFAKAVESLAHHRLLALPVVDYEHKLKGVIDVQMCLEENIDLFKEQRNQDIFQLVGLTIEEDIAKFPFRSYRGRMPWILCNMFGGVACAVVSYVFQIVLGKILILAMFIPLVLSLSESISMQSMTQSFQILRKQHISFKKVLLSMCSEIRVAALMALTSGVLVTCISLFWEPRYEVSLIMGIGVAISIVFSALVGTGIPLLLHLKNLDPKVASGPVVLTIADVLTTVTYLSLATWFLL